MKRYVMAMVAIGALSVASWGGENKLYKNNCATCHGIHAEKSAIGKSTPIKGMPADKIIESLEAYASGSKPSALPVAKVIKHKFLSEHSKEEVRELAEYISKL